MSLYESTRSSTGGTQVSASMAVIKGLSPDGGLFVPKISELNKEKIQKVLNQTDYKKIAKGIFGLFLDDFTKSDIDEIVEASYSSVNFKNRIVGIKNFGDYSFLELYHGKTLAFKDMALSALPNIMSVAKRKNSLNGKKTVILVATSGDTGGAALAGFQNSLDTDMFVIYPNNGVSVMQERQMLSFCRSGSIACAYSGNFDDCQTLVKKIFLQNQNNKDILLSSANSINIGRLVPQIVYYIYAYSNMVLNGQLKRGEKLNVVVPTGNFGNILALKYAKILGLPIGKIVCASNANNVLYDFLTTGIYDRNRNFYKTVSPAMDILISSNLERFIYIASGGDKKLVNSLMESLSKTGKYIVPKEVLKQIREDFIPSWSSDEEAKKAISEMFSENEYLIDTHTAVAYSCYKKVKGELKGKTLIASTASPFKFPNAVAESIGVKITTPEGTLEDIAKKAKIELPEQLLSFYKKPVKPTVVSENDINSFLKQGRTSCTVSVPGSSANLGAGFDCAGIAWNIYKSFNFEVSTSNIDINDKSDSNRDSLILSSYKKVFEIYKKPYVPVKITKLVDNVARSRGIGSSSTCIVAGIMAASYFLNGILSKREIVNIATDIEGHPDNVASAVYGGFVVSAKNGNDVVSVNYPVNKNLKFYVAYPSFTSQTSETRAKISKEIKLSDVVVNISKMGLLPQAFNKGDIDLLSLCFEEKIHQDIRLKNIPNAVIIRKELIKNGFAVCLSGAGSALLAIATKERLKDIKDIVKSKSTKEVLWQAEEVIIDFEGAKIC